MASHIHNICINCDACAKVCPTNSIFKGDRQYLIDTDTCTDCQHCAKVCPVSAIEVVAPKVKPLVDAKG